MEAIGCNPPLMPAGMPFVGRGVPSQFMYDQGTLPGALASVVLIPTTERAIVILPDFLALNDTPEWIGQLILEELLGVPSPRESISSKPRWPVSRKV